MGRVVALDYGGKRSGLAATDTLKLIANPLKAVPTSDLKSFIAQYCTAEEVETLVVGDPLSLQGKKQPIEIEIQEFVKWFSKQFPTIEVVRMDERFTSSIAARALIDGGLKKNKRRDKTLLDVVSAVLILQAYLEKHH
jgi:putative Holliday junction resolvase